MAGAVPKGVGPGTTQNASYYLTEAKDKESIRLTDVGAELLVDVDEDALCAQVSAC